MRRQKSKHEQRKGMILVYAAFLMVVVFGFAAFTVDVGHIALVKDELQNAADGAALAGAMRLGDGASGVRAEAIDTATRNFAGKSNISMSNSDIELGTYDMGTKVFTINEANPNAVRVTARVANRSLFFGGILGKSSYNKSAQAIAMLNPRDIAFVIDLSGSMNNDTEPCWATGAINSEMASTSPGIGNTIMQTLYTDFGYGTFPGTLQHVGSTLGVTADNYAYGQMTKDNGPLTSNSIPSTYRISNSNNEATRRLKAYKYMIDYQIAVVMPNAKPTPNSSSNYSYWEKYLDYIIKPQSTTTSGSKGVPRNGSNSSVTLPSSQDGDQLSDFGNPDTSMYPSLSSSVLNNYYNKIGYLTYVQFMMDWGRDRSPDADNSNNSADGTGTKVPLSTLSSHCPWHSEATAGGTFSFPPREQPTHAVRRSLIAALQIIKTQNAGVSAELGDKVSIISFDAIDSYHAPKIEIALTANFDAAMQACTSLQAVADVTYSTSTENGLIKARDHIKPTTSGGSGRRFTKKVFVLLTDGIPNISQTNNSTIQSYASANPSSDWYSTSSGNTTKNAPIYQSALIKDDNATLYPVGVGFGCNYDFMDRVARMNGTDENGQVPRGSGNPAEYEQVMTDIFTNIIKRPGVRLVK